MRLIVLIFLWSVVLPACALAQKRYIVQYHTEGDSMLPVFRKQFPAKESARDYLEKLPSLLVGQGFMAAAVDSFSLQESSGEAWVFLGQQFKWQSLQFDTVATQWLAHMGIGEQEAGKFPGIITPDSLQRMMLQFLAGNGYPFASVHWRQVQLEQGAISGTLALETGPPYKVDSIVQHGKAKFSKSFLYRYLQMQPGMLYNQHLIDAADNRLDELVFVQRQQSSEVQMLGTGSMLNVFLEPRRANVLNVLVGLMPASSQTPDSKLMLTGDVNMVLRNTFGSGETMGVNWQQLQYKSPRLNLLYQQPYLFATKAGIDFQFDLFKKDSQFLNLQVRIGMPYEFSATKTGKLFYQLQQNTVAFVDTNLVRQSRQLPELSDFSVSMIGVQWLSNTTDYRLNPRRGAWFDVSGTAGLKNIRKSDEILGLKDPIDPGFNYGTLYDTVKLKTYQVRVQAALAKYLPLGGNAVMKAALQAGLLQSGNYFRNELFQIGGSKILRGFDEESIYAKTYAVATAEFRYLTGRNGFLFAFADGGFARYQDATRSFGHGYWGSGLGLTLEARTSQVSLSWAVGKRNDQPLNLRQSKIHIGLINYF